MSKRQHRVKCVSYYNDQGTIRYVFPRGADPPPFWTLFGGGVEKGEDDRTALLREIEEESDSLVKVLKIHPIKHHLHILGYRASPSDPIPTPTKWKSEYHLFLTEIAPIDDQPLGGEMEYVRSFSIDEVQDLADGKEVDGYSLWPVDLEIVRFLLPML